MNDAEFANWLDTQFVRPEPQADCSDIAERVWKRSRRERLERHAMLGIAIALGVGIWLGITSGQTSLDLVAAGLGQALRALEGSAVETVVLVSLTFTALAAWRTTANS